MPTMNKKVPEMDLVCQKPKETVKKLYVRDIYVGHFGFHVENICSTQYILVYF